MSDLPTCSAPNGTTVKVTIPPGWFTYVSGLARSKLNQMIRMRVSNSNIDNIERLVHTPKKRAQTNETMKNLKTHEDSYVIKARDDVQQLDLMAYYSMDPNIKGHELEEKNAVVKGLRIRQAETPEHLLQEFPHYITFFVFVQASPDQKETEYAPLYNDAVCTINLIKGTRLDHDGAQMQYEGGRVKGPNDNDNTSGGGTTGGGATGGGTTNDDLSNAALDIVFVQDCTGSQQDYIKASIDNILKISTKIASSANLAPDALRLRLIGFRDAGDPEYVTKPFAFTSDVSVMRSNLSTLVATGGGDGPEAVAEALDAALMSEWRVDATKLVILITDAPPHGIGEPDDVQSKKPLAGKEPLTTARRMAELGITLHLVACEPTLSSSYKYAYDFYKALTRITGGLILPLVSATKLADYIIGSSLERVELDALVSADGKKIADRVLFKQETLEALTEEYHAKYAEAGVTVTTLEIESVYAEYAEGLKNIDTYDKAHGVYEARPLLKVPGARLLPKFASGSVSPTVTLAKKPISKEQTGRVAQLSVTKNAKLSDSGDYVPRPASVQPAKNSNSFRINIPKEWYGFITGLSRAKYNQTIKIGYTEYGHPNTGFMTSDRGQTDEVMRSTLNMENFYIFAASEDTDIVLDTSFFWSKDKVKGEALDKPQYASQKLKVIQTQTPKRHLPFFPDYISYLIMAEDQPEADQVAGVPDFNDCIGIVNLIKKTPMVYNDEE